MADVTNLPTTAESKAASAPATRLDPFETLRREVDRLFENFNLGGRFPLGARVLDLDMPWSRPGGAGVAPPVDVVEKDAAYEVTAELPGLSEADIEVTAANGMLTIKGEKKAETEQREKDYYLSERRYGSFVRSFRLPQGVDSSKIEAAFAKGVLTVTLPKSADALQNGKKIAIKAA